MEKEFLDLFSKSLKPFPRFLQRLYFKSLLRSVPNYQPILLKGGLAGDRGRNCHDRWQMIKKEILSRKVETLLDIGCAEGFYVLSAAKECGCLSIGIDSDPRRLAIAQNQLLTENISGAGFILGMVGHETFNKIPKSDIMIFMSVMHHIMYTFGKDYCLNYLKKLKPSIGKVMIFEMGQSNETKNVWASKLPDMGKNPHQWIKNFLLSAGFSKVTKVGESDSYQKDRERAIFTVEP